MTANDLVVTLFYLVPPSIGTWCVSRSFGFALVGAGAGAFTYLVNQALETSSHGAYVLILNTAVEGGVFVTVVLLLGSLATHLQLERQARALAEESLANVRRLSALLPMCASCKKIRHGPDGSWEPLDTYPVKHSDTRISHGVCPECMAKLYPEQFRKAQERKAQGHE